MQTQETKRPYKRFPKLPLEQKILAYVQALHDGWGRNYARAISGLKIGRVDYQDALRDPRVQEAHRQNREAFLTKQRNKLG